MNNKEKKREILVITDEIIKHDSNIHIPILGIVISGGMAGWLFCKEVDGRWGSVIKFPIDPKIFGKANIHHKTEEGLCPNCSKKPAWIRSTEDNKIHVCLSCNYKWEYIN